MAAAAGRNAPKRVQQWLTFSRQWWLFDATWQDPFQSSMVIAKHLKGEHKPIYGGASDCGDHVVVINSADIALKADEWYYRAYLHHTGYARGCTWTKAWELHKIDPTKIIYYAVYRSLKRNLERRPHIARLHVYKDDNVPDEIMTNVSNQIRPLRKIPKRLDHFEKDDVKEFPKLFDYPKDYIYR